MQLRKMCDPCCVIGADTAPRFLNVMPESFPLNSEAGSYRRATTIAVPESSILLAVCAERWILRGVSFLMSPSSTWKTQASDEAWITQATS